MTIEIADRLVKLRKKYGYSQEELADKLGLSRQAVSKWERAEASPDTDNLICLAKLYGVSLDELLATDEDVDTIVKEQVKEENKTDDSNKNKRVVINDDGIRITKKDGSTVVIGDDGITTTDKDGVVIKKHDRPDKAMGIIGCVEGLLFLLATAAYLLLGFLLNLWGSAWIVFFIPEIVCSIARSIRKKNANQFNIVFLACFVFFLVCMMIPALNPSFPQYWTPMWVVFISIPVYYVAVNTIHKITGRNCEDDDDEDDEDDED